MDFTDFIASGVSNFILLISLVDEVQAQIISKWLKFKDLDVSSK